MCNRASTIFLYLWQKRRTQNCIYHSNYNIFFQIGLRKLSTLLFFIRSSTSSIEINHINTQCFLLYMKSFLAMISLATTHPSLKITVCLYLGGSDEEMRYLTTHFSFLPSIYSHSQNLIQRIIRSRIHISACR